MTCDCITQINERLKAENLELSDSSFSLKMPTFNVMISIPTEWLDKSKAPKGRKSRTPRMFATFCPFCGKKAES